MERSPTSLNAVAAMVALGKDDAADKALCDVALSATPEGASAGHEMRKRGGCPLEPILDKLKSSSTAADALSALAALGPTAKDAAPKVLPFITDNNASIRRLAIEAAGELGDPSAGPALLKAYETENKALDTLRADWVQVKLEPKYGKEFDPDAAAEPVSKDGQAKVKQTDLMKKVQALALAKAQEGGKTIREPLAPKELVDDASAAQLETLSALVRALGKLKVEGGLSIAQKYTDEVDPNLRAAAYSALPGYGPEGLKLAEPGLAETDRDVQSATAKAFIEAGAEAPVLAQLKVQGGDRSRLLEGYRNHAPTQDAVTILVQLVKDGGVEAGFAAQLLGEIGAPPAVDALIKALEDPTLVPRREVLLALGKLKDPKSAEMVGKDLYNDRSEVRAAAAEALETIGAGNALDALDALRGDYYRKVREAASHASSKLNPEAKH